MKVARVHDHQPDLRRTAMETLLHRAARIRRAAQVELQREAEKDPEDGTRLARSAGTRGEGKAPLPPWGIEVLHLTLLLAYGVELSILSSYVERFTGVVSCHSTGFAT